MMRPTTMIGSPTVGYTGSSSADGLREMPAWCSWWPFAQSCQPYSEAELKSLSRAQATYEANSPSSNIPVEERPAWIDAQVEEANRVAELARQSDPDANQWTIPQIAMAAGIGLIAIIVLIKR